MATRGRACFAAVVATTLLLVAGCSSDDEASTTEQQKAQELVASVHAAGLAPRLDVDTVESLYGEDAAAVCDVFEDGLTTAERNLLLGNPAHGRRRTITDDAVAYGRLVVQTYCPENLDEYDHAVKDLDPFETTDR